LRIAAMSFGNSRISAAMVEGVDVVEKRSVPTEHQDTWCGFIEWILARGRGSPKVAVSVNPSPFAAFEAQISERMILLGRDREIPMQNQTLHPEQTGHDRLLSGYGASRIYGPPLIVMDCGTALTINAIDGTGAFIGGAIAPGLGLAAASLAGGCALLPQTDCPSNPVPLIGRDTESAIRSGLLNGYLKGIESLACEFLKASSEDCRIIVTGGEALLIAANVSFTHIHDPDLLLKGVAMACDASKD